MNTDRVMQIKTDMMIEEKIKRRIKSALMTAWELGALDPNAPLPQKMKTIEELMKDLER